MRAHMTASEHKDLVDRLNAGEGIGACLSGDSNYVENIMRSAARKIKQLQKRLGNHHDK